MFHSIEDLQIIVEVYCEPSLSICDYRMIKTSTASLTDSSTVN